MANQQLTQSELELIKLVTNAWIVSFATMPPKELLACYVAIHRLAQVLIEARSKVNMITLTQAPTIDSFYSQTQIIQSQMRTRL